MSGGGYFSHVRGNSDHIPVPLDGSYIRERDGKAASLLDDADYPVAGECKICRIGLDEDAPRHGAARIRLRGPFQVEWEHAPVAQGAQ